MSEDPLSQELKTTPPGYPRGLEHDYAAKLRGIALGAHRFMWEGIKEYLRNSGYRVDEDAPLMPPGLVGIIAQLAVQYGDQFPTVAATAAVGSTADSMARWSLTRLTKETGAPIAEWFPTVAAFGGQQDSVIRDWTDLNAMLVGATGDPASIPNQYFLEVAEHVRDAQEAGLTIESLSGILQERYGVAESRGNLIARTEIAKLNGQLTEAQQSDVGITAYRWETSRDSRVRETHQANQGLVFDWNQPPPNTGHPGQDFQCRCIARPILPDWAIGSGSARDNRSSS